MPDEMLTQEQIDKYLKNEAEETKVSNNINSILTENEIDIIGEAANIFIATSATTLSMILDKRVRITSPIVTIASLSEIYENMMIPYVALKVEFKSGISGENLLLLKTIDASVISDIMMGGDGTDLKEKLDELELSAVSEAMNQMIGSATTSMATMLNRSIDISPPEVKLLETDADKVDELENPDKEFVQIAFEMTIDGVLESTIMQLYSVEAVKDIVEAFTLEVLADAEGDIVPVKDEADLAEATKVSQDEISKKEHESTELVNYPERIEMLLDVTLDLTVVFGSARKTVKELLSLGEGSIVELDKYIDDPLEIFVNNKLIGYGEVVVVDENFGIRITSLVDVKDRIK